MLASRRTMVSPLGGEVQFVPSGVRHSQTLLPTSVWRQIGKVHIAAPPKPLAPTTWEDSAQDPLPAIVAEDAPQNAHTNSPHFNYNKCWWPVVSVDYLEIDRPHPATLLGVNLVLWRQPLLATDPNGPGIWRAFKDECPHRLAPLSEGRVENGQLQCSYHGWRFGGDGRCTTIPQSIDAKAEATACASNRSCAKGFPTQERVGLLWVWPDDSPTAAIDSAATAPVVTKGAEETFAGPKGRRSMWTVRDMMYSYELLLENVADPAHLPFSHHMKGAGQARTDAGPMNFTALSAAERETSEAQLPVNIRDWDLLAAGSVSAGSKEDPALPPGSKQYLFSNKISQNGRVSFLAPHQITYLYTMGSAMRFGLMAYATPTSPGRCRLFTSSTQTQVDALKVSPWQSFVGTLALLSSPAKLKTTAMQAIRTQMMRMAPTWAPHMFTCSFLDQDNVFLAGQQQTLQRKYGNKWREAYYMPNPCDKLVIHLRKWMDQAAGRPPMADQEVPAMALDRHAILDHYSQHTAFCRHCKAAVTGIQRCIAISQIAAAALAVALCAAIGMTAPAIAAATAANSRNAAVGNITQHFAAFSVGNAFFRTCLAAGGGLWAVLWPVIGIAVALAATVVLMRRWEAMLPQFYFQDYVHADNN